MTPHVASAGGDRLAFPELFNLPTMQFSPLAIDALPLISTALSLLELTCVMQFGAWMPPEPLTLTALSSV